VGERAAGTPSPFESSRNIRCYGRASSMTIGSLPWFVKVRTASIRGPRMIHSAYLGPLMPFAGVSRKGRWRWYRRGGVHGEGRNGGDPCSCSR